ncbi:MAG TPA: hypothetical protein EYP69_05605 [Bacteroidales bacterium]|nr:hypothetical protein [Bacteroidales bacterium]
MGKIKHFCKNLITKLMLKNEFVALLKKYFIEKATIYVANIVEKYNIQLVFTKPRKTRKGTFIIVKNQSPKITLNRDMKPEEMLFVFLHETAHLLVFKKYGKRKKPHGLEWQKIFLMLVKENIKNGNFSEKTREILLKCFFTPTLHYHPNCKLLHTHFRPLRNKNNLYLYQLSVNDKFIIDNDIKKQFILKKKRKTQYLCKNLVNEKLYLVHSFIEIKKIYE